MCRLLGSSTSERAARGSGGEGLSGPAYDLLSLVHRTASDGTPHMLSFVRSLLEWMIGVWNKA